MTNPRMNKKLAAWTRKSRAASLEKMKARRETREAMSRKAKAIETEQMISSALRELEQSRGGDHFAASALQVLRYLVGSPLCSRNEAREIAGLLPACRECGFQLDRVERPDGICADCLFP